MCGIRSERGATRRSKHQVRPDNTHVSVENLSRVNGHLLASGPCAVAFLAHVSKNRDIAFWSYVPGRSSAAIASSSTGSHPPESFYQNLWPYDQLFRTPHKVASHTNGKDRSCDVAFGRAPVG